MLQNECNAEHVEDQHPVTQKNAFAHRDISINVHSNRKALSV